MCIRDRSQAGVMSPVLFLLPTLDPLYPTSSSGERRGSEATPSMKLFGTFEVDSHMVYAVILGLSAVAFVLLFALVAPTFDVRTPDPPDHTPSHFSGPCTADTVMCLVFAQSKLLQFCQRRAPEMPSYEVPDVAEVLRTSMENVDMVVPGFVDTEANHVAEMSDPDVPEETPETQSVFGTGCGSTRAAPHHQEPRPGELARLWPLAIQLFFVVGSAQFAGLVLALVYVLTLDDDHSYSVAAWACTMCVVVGFPASILYVCCFMMPAVVEDRKARLEGPEWVECQTGDRTFYYNVLTEESQWEEPAEFKLNAAAVPAVPLEISRGIDCLIGSYHGENLISRYFALVELCHAVVGVAMVMTVYWRGSTKAAWFLTAMQAADAMLTTVGMPLIDSSDSQRNMENKATAAASWLMAGAMAVLAVDMYSEDWHEETLQWLFLSLSLLASLMVPLVCFIDSKLPTSEVEADKDDCSGVCLTSSELKVAHNPLARSGTEMHGSEEDTHKQDAEPQETTVQGQERRFTKADAKVELEEWKRLRDTGELSADEYKARKAQLRERRRSLNKPSRSDPTLQI
eukprot:TRINITY_DN2648_c0_g1_i8.p1 TRINITY_DN2648_c0_g1~~TRINITY_DN2648_c0_g1_i8.p1  ORF type:complete len:571 (+),score=126.40 TRINITY_DN2648_c0_g1_i8:85-1797(+)